MNVECMFILFSAMVSPIISILSNDKLTGENYIKWKSNMNAILVCEDLKFGKSINATDLYVLVHSDKSGPMSL